jgi:hypothetical protein
MELTYESMVKFMEEYFPVYSEYGQDPATAHRLNDYYTPDFVLTGYVGFPEPLVYTSRDAFLAFDVSHPSSYERLTPEDMTVDERRKTVFVIIKLEFIDRKTGEVLVKERGATQYQLVLDQNDRIKVKSFVFFPQRVAPGILTGTDVFMKDWQASQSG